jgi:hypothetical protein
MRAITQKQVKGIGSTRQRETRRDFIINGRTHMLKQNQQGVY